MTSGILAWAHAAAVRATKTAAQTAVGIIGASTAWEAVDWRLAASATALAAVASLLTSIAGLPEVENGTSVYQLSEGGDTHGRPE